jgi:hypothetical protein
MEISKSWIRLKIGQEVAKNMSKTFVVHFFEMLIFFEMAAVFR